MNSKATEVAEATKRVNRDTTEVVPTALLHRSFDEIIKRLNGPVKEPVGVDGTPMASLSGGRNSRGFFDRLFNMGTRDAANMAQQPEIRHFFHEDDLNTLNRIVSLPHWIAKNHPGFAKVYERQLRRMDERASALMKSLQEVPSLFGKGRLDYEYPTRGRTSLPERWMFSMAVDEWHACVVKYRQALLGVP